MIQLFFCTRVHMEPAAWCCCGLAPRAIDQCTDLGVPAHVGEQGCGVGGALPLKLFSQGRKENLFLTVVPRATWRGWRGAGGRPSAASSGPRVAQRGYSDCVLWGHAELSRRIVPGLSLNELGELGRTRFEFELTPLLLLTRLAGRR